MSLWLATAAGPALVAAVLIAGIRHRRRRRGQRTGGAATVGVAGDLEAIRSALSCLDRIKADLQVVVTEGPLSANELVELGLAERIDRLAGLLKNQLLQHAARCAEHASRVLRSPYPGVGLDDAQTATWQHVRQAIGRAATQQAAAHAAIDALRELGAELRSRELELAGKMFAGRD